MIELLADQEKDAYIQSLEARIKVLEGQIAHEQSQPTPSPHSLNYRFLFDANQTPQLVLNPTDLHIIAANQAAIVFYGYSHDQLHGMDFVNLNVLDHETIHRRFQQVLNSRDDANACVECAHRRADGVKLPVEVFPVQVMADDVPLWLLTITEISDDLELKLELQRSEELFRQIGDMANVGGWEVDLKTMTPMWSSYVYDIHGVPPDYQPDMDQAINFYAPEARPIIEKAVTEAVQQGTSWDLELPFINARGEHLWVRSMGRPVFWEGECVKLYGVFQDITQQHAANERIRHSESRYRHVSELLADYAYEMVVDTDGSIKRAWIIGAFERITGYTPAEIDAMGGWAAIVHPDDMNEVVAAIKRMATTNIARNYASAYRIIRKDGRYRHIEAINCPVYDDKSGRLVRIYGAAQDVTDNVQAVQQLEQSEERYRKVVQNQSELICQYNTDYELTFVNDAVSRFFGESPDYLIGSSMLHLFSEPMLKLFLSAHQDLHDNQATVRVQSELIGPDGETAVIEWTSTPVYDQQHNFTQVLSVGHNITDRLRAQEQARLLELEQARINLITEFINNATHEFRTPLTTIGSSVYLMVRTDDPARRQERAGRITEQIDRITMLVDMLARMAVLDGHPSLNYTPVDLNVLLREVVDSMRSSMDDKSILASINVSPEVSEIVVDYPLLSEGLQHFMNNAVRYNQQGGSVVLRAYPKKDTVVISITDTGSGMPPFTSKHLFERFYRGDSAHTTPGLGLGAAIGARIIELHNGSIRVRSTPGVGTTLLITLPLDRPSTENASHYQ